MKIINNDTLTTTGTIRIEGIFTVDHDDFAFTGCPNILMAPL